jgi:hypothetical protein
MPTVGMRTLRGLPCDSVYYASFYFGNINKSSAHRVLVTKNFISYLLACSDIADASDSC